MAQYQFLRHSTPFSIHLIISAPRNDTIADTVAAVFRGRQYALHRSVSLWDIIMRWIAQLAARLFGFAAAHPAVGYVVRTAIILAVVLVAVRVGYSLLLARRSPALTFGPGSTKRGGDWWQTSQRLAAAGDFTAAAHALYLALITGAASRGLVLLDDSKTTGDYLRELRQAANDADAHHFADFTRSYETVIYGIGICDSERFTRLRTLAAGMLGPIAGGNA
ncbi:MAG: DUF4129 domain-containing protein [Gemmatimonadaceae bacterium]